MATGAPRSELLADAVEASLHRAAGGRPLFKRGWHCGAWQAEKDEHLVAEEQVRRAAQQVLHAAVEQRAARGHDRIVCARRRAGGGRLVQRRPGRGQLRWRACTGNGTP